METEFLATAVEAARAAAGVLEKWAGKFSVSEKSPANYVTEADLESQRIIRDIIRERFPDHGFLGEEEFSAGEERAERAGTTPYRWIVDPLDGTSNYVHRFPYYAVSIALEENGERIVGVVFDPNREELFTARRGGGAFLNGQAIHPSTRERADEALILVSLPVNVAADHFAVREFLAVLEAAQHVQRTGSAALNLCYVACGRAEAFLSHSLKPWDMAAGALLVEEAGGRVTKTSGQPFELSQPDLLASNGTALHEELMALLQKCHS